MRCYAPPWLSFCWLCLLVAADESCEAVGEVHESKDGRRHRDDSVEINMPGGLGDEAGLIALHLATDGRRWQVRLGGTPAMLPDRVSGELQLLGEHIDGAVLSRFRRADEELILVLRTLQGATKTIVARAGGQWRPLGPVEDGNCGNCPWVNS
eukprot:Skav218544  [mRNA]  locus=scaffold3191:172529:181036:+ [translate_table: standard]